MKLLILSAFLLAILVADTTAQFYRCPQRVGPAACLGPRNPGFKCPTSPPRILWHYDHVKRACLPMKHLGCGGNPNRWCTRHACQHRCMRSASG